MECSSPATVLVLVAKRSPCTATTHMEWCGCRCLSNTPLTISQIYCHKLIFSALWELLDLKARPEDKASAGSLRIEENTAAHMLSRHLSIKTSSKWSSTKEAILVGVLKSYS